MKYPVKILKILAVFVVAILFITCTKEPQEIGSNLLSPDELLSLGYTDTSTIVAFTVPQDSLSSSGSYYGLAGSIYDPVFGKTTATWFGQLSLNTDEADFGNNPVLDSAFMYVKISAVYGDTMSQTTLNLYEVTGNFDSTSYTSHTLPFNSQPIGSITFIPSAYDSIFYEGSMHGSVIRIPVDHDFANKILTADSTKLYDSTFTDFIKGVCIAPPYAENTPGKGAIIKFIAVTSSYLKVYYHNDEDTTNYKFVFESDGLHFTNYNHYNYEHAAPALKNQINGDTALGGQYLFLQTMSGLKVKMQFPYLKSWFNNQKVVINDAQLIITNTSPSGIFAQPSGLVLRKIDADGSQSSEYLDDASLAGYDGSYDEDSKTYRFRITRYIQGLMLGTERRFGLFLVLPSESETATRLAINGPKNAQSNLKLYIKYTVVE